jgi:FlaA1/EpsC-like NDP-sugar epimerase
MRIFKKETFVLFLGDIIFFFLSLWLSLFLRYGHFPSKALLYIHLIPFSILFAVWLVVFFIAGLYEKHTLILKGKLPSAIFNTQLINSVVAVAFFYIIPYFGITPKTVLFIYLIVSFFLILFWRLYGTLIFGRRRGPRQSAILIGTGNEMKELLDEVNGNSHYDIKFISSIDVKDLSAINIQEDIVGPIYENNIKIVAVDFSHENVSPLLPHLYNLIFSKVRFIDSHRIYEDIFDRVPLSLVNYSWFLENISVSPKFTYDFLKRVMDILISLPLLLVPIIALPFV